MMNERGWSFQSFIVFLIIIGIALLISVFIITRYFNIIIDTTGISFIRTKENNSGSLDQSRTYNSMEIDMITAARKYVSKLYKSGLDEDKLYIKVTSLYNEKVLNSLVDIKDEGIICTGYVVAHKEDYTNVYKSYLKCGNNYKTKGYIARFDG